MTPTLLRAAVVGLVVGAATSWAQTVLHGPWSALANAASPWVAPAFVVGVLAPTLALALPAGALLCVAEVAGYYLTAGARGFPVGAHVSTWAVLGLVAGPVFAGAGWLCRQGPSVGWRAVGAAAVPAILLAEAARYAVVLHYRGEAALFAVLAAVAGQAVWAVASSNDSRSGAESERR
ncbi:hypothetical protein CLV35_1385 [Motilibacter peucedani]|uniref:Uncharacterized protein n=1 Tax=Motilibacter peucedani TaxID=598650 RepID=A0A420XS95_9ACTN|nr:DUF6518 family protein [Motilibacter peucedani]RKS77691.1 hypothetical protein CLV35_1385 [Motilibacter peucedani]